MSSPPSKGSPSSKPLVLMTLKPGQTKEEQRAIFRGLLTRLGVPIKPSTNPQPPSRIDPSD